MVHVSRSSRSYTQTLALLVVVVGPVVTQTLALEANPPPPKEGLAQQVAELQAQVNALQAQEGADVSSLQAQIDALQQQIDAWAALVNPPPPATRFVDNGDGTITDHQTGLMWEKKDSAGGLHDMDGRFTFAAANGEFIDRLNGRLTDAPLAGGFAGHTDWRMPTSAELATILTALFPNCSSSPCVDAVFNTGCIAGCTVTSCSCTAAAPNYWSSTAATSHSSDAWGVAFSTGFVASVEKDVHWLVRAVRGGR